jgi:RNA polymerase sigma-70 factor (ECF subfamily)
LTVLGLDAPLEGVKAGSAEVLEARIRASHDGGDVRGATAAAIEGYGAEVLGFLLALLRDEQAAQDVYSDWSEDVIRGLADFRWESSFRTWAYTLARHRLQQAWARARTARTVPLSAAPEVLEVQQRARSSTPPHARSSVKERIAKLREELSPEEQTLLILRVDRGFAWLDVARVMGGSAALLRKRFERIKDRLRVLAREARLLETEEQETSNGW